MKKFLNTLFSFSDPLKSFFISIFISQIYLLTLLNQTPEFLILRNIMLAVLVLSFYLIVYFSIRARKELIIEDACIVELKGDIKTNVLYEEVVKIKPQILLFSGAGVYVSTKKTSIFIPINTKNIEKLGVLLNANVDIKEKLDRKLSFYKNIEKNTSLVLNLIAVYLLPAIIIANFTFTNIWGIDTLILPVLVIQTAFSLYSIPVIYLFVNSLFLSDKDVIINPILYILLSVVFYMCFAIFIKIKLGVIW